MEGPDLENECFSFCDMEAANIQWVTLGGRWGHHCDLDTKGLASG